jgi:hypothetical protein
MSLIAELPRRNVIRMAVLDSNSDLLNNLREFRNHK